jgi:tetratricopeptide (TPR) repeat protein
MLNRIRDRVFVSYSHKDKEWLDKFRDILGPDIRNGRVDYWDDRELQPGDPWFSKILEGISAARVAVLLISPNFLASQFIMEKEVPRILAARDEGLTIIWVPLFGSFIGLGGHGQIDITTLQAAFEPGKPLAEQDPESQVKLLLDVCRQIERILNPGRVPWNLPFSSLAELFKGRDKALAELDRSLRQHGAAAVLQPQAIYGLAGTGKTRLAIEYAWRHQNDFSAFLFVSANKPDDLDRNLAALCRPGDCLDLPEYRSPSQDEQRDAVIRWLQQNKDWLLILDNVDTDEGVRAVKALVAKLRGGHVLITSRVPEWGRGVRPTALDVLPLEEAVKLLLESTRFWRPPRPEDMSQARSLAERLGNLPLALTHAAAYMEHNHQGFGEYLEDFESHFERLLAYHDHVAIEYETELEREEKEPATWATKTARKKLLKTVATTFFLSFDRLSSEAKAILQGASFLAPAPIPIAMFEQCPEETAGLVELWCDTAGAFRTGQALFDALADLAHYSLIHRSDGMFSVHRMEQYILKSRVAEANVPQWHERICAVLRKYAPEETSESPRTWPVWDVLRPHAEVLVASFVSNDRIPADLELMGSVGTLLFGKGLYALSLKVEEDAVKVAERLAGAESEAMADKLLNYGESLRVLDRSQEALEVFQHSTAIREKLDGKDGLRVAAILNYEGIAYGDLNRTKEAEACYRRALSIYESHKDEVDPLDRVKVLNNLAGLICAAGSLDEGESLLRTAVALTANDPDNKIKPQTAIICRAQLANLLAKKGDGEGATRLFCDALTRVSVFPEEHPLREAVMESYATFLRSAHKLSEAKNQFTNATSGVRPRWGSDEFRSQPERRIRCKLRVIEATATIPCDPPVEEKYPTLVCAVRSELHNPPPQPWFPRMLRGITVTDTEHLGFHFLINTGSENSYLDENPQATRELMEFFLTAVAVDEADQWAAADGSMPRPLRGTSLGAELLQQAQTLACFTSCALNEDNPVRTAFMGAFQGTGPLPRGVSVEVWLSPVNSKVYSGDPIGDWARFGTSGVANAMVVRAQWEVSWQWQVRSNDGKNLAAEWMKRLDTAFEAHVAPVIKRWLEESRVFGSLRQMNYCMILGLWFKEKYRYHPNVSRFLETGDAKQLTPTIRTIASLSKTPGEGVKEVDVSASEAVWQRAIDLNNRALELRKEGRLAESESLLREALRLDEQLRGSSDPKIAHRLNNLSTVLIMQRNTDEAGQALVRAWAIKQSTAHDITSLRILFVRIMLALLEKESPAQFCGQLKTLLAVSDLGDKADVVKKWDIDCFVDQLRPKLPVEWAAFLTALTAVLNDRSQLSRLDEFDLWKSQPRVSLESKWPETVSLVQ